ncbi:MAG: GNAT family N-acetyltransferase [Actinomycetota bacterium]|nr:GNAT family N-acetyltransferase [Actinomycetota bacterium]
MATVSQPGAGRWLTPIVLEGRHVRLEPLTMEHVGELWAAAQDDEVWRWLSVLRPVTVQDMNTVIGAALAEQVRGERLPWAIVEGASGQAVGSTSYLDVVPAHRRLEIGWTWLGRAFWRTPINTAAKLLLLEHAFDGLGAHRVAFQTDSSNLRSQAAIERIGGVREGVLRAHKIRPDGSRRDSVFFSVLGSEWPTVHGRLTARLTS